LKAIVYHSIGDIRLEDIDIPEINENEALLKVKVVALCGTDLRVKASGHRSIKEGQTRILGHEVSGIIEKVGNKVSSLKVGARVAVAPVSGCGVCRQCITGNEIFCSNDLVLGLSINGGMSEYMVIPEPHIKGGNVFVLPKDMRFDIAAIAEPLATVFTGLSACNIKPADIVLIVGAGPVGLMHLQMAKIFGAAKVIVSEVIQSRRAIATEFGADYVINPIQENLKEIVLKNSFGRGADIVIIAAASPEAQSQSIDIAAIGGSINFFGTLPKEKEKVMINSNQIHYKNLKIVGTTGSTVANYCRTMELLILKKIDLSKFISKRFKFEEYKKAFELAKSTSSLKVIFVI
jgi:L-iditol 2-dehydrogenase